MSEPTHGFTADAGPSDQAQRALRWLEHFISRLGAYLSASTTGPGPFFSQAILPAMDRLAGIATGLAAMLLVDHHYGPVGLGLFAWFVSLLAIAGYLAQQGVPAYVENAVARAETSAAIMAGEALAALIALGLAGLLFSILAVLWAGGPGWGAGDTFLYLLLGPTLLFQNINALRLALLNATGRHGQAAGLRIRQRIIFLAIMLVLCQVKAPVPLLAVAFLISQMVMAAMGRKRLKLPSVCVVVTGRTAIAAMVRQGRAFLFADNLLDVVFYLDLLILGWFVGPVELGVYARAMVLMRLFLILPAGLQPVFRRRANQLVGAADRVGLQQLVARTARVLFLLHGLLAIFILVHFPRVMAIFFNVRNWTDQAFAVFALVVPGLVFHSLVTAMGPLFEASGETSRLRQLALVVAGANFVLNINLVPLAGLSGAALATTLAMFIHFWLFCRWLPADVARIGIFWPGAAAALYLTYVPLAALDIGIMPSMLLAPLLFGGLLWGTGCLGPAARGQGAETIYQPMGPGPLET